MGTTQEQQAGDSSGKWDSAAWRTARDENLRRWLLGDEAAVQCLVMLSNIAETWDDVVDKEEVDASEVNTAFVQALVLLQGNPFYCKHQYMLMGVVVASINAWLDSIQLEKGATEAERMAAFYLRNFAQELLPLSAFLLGGWEHMRAVSAEARKFFTHETYAQWEHRL